MVSLGWSGGKDSALALAALRNDPDVHVHELLTTVSTPFDRVVMHGVRRELLERQAAAIAVPLRVVRLPPAPSNEAYDTAMRDALENARSQGVTHAAFGDLHLEDVRSYRVAALDRIGLSALFPLWGWSTEAAADAFIDAGFRAVLTCVDTTRLDGALVGREFDRTLLRELPPTVDPCGENGEFHTFVYDGPLLAHPIPFTFGETVLRNGRFRYVDLLPSRMDPTDTGAASGRS